LSQIILKQITYQIFSYSHISLLITSLLETVKIGLEQLLKCLSKKIREKWFNLHELTGRGNLFPLKATFLISHLYPIRIFATNRSGSKKHHFSL